MNKKEQLITDALGHGEGDSFARQAAKLARRRQAVKQAGFAGGLVATGLVAVFLATRPAPRAATVALPSGPTVEIISDQELVAQLQGQPVILIKDDTRITGVVFLTPPDTGTKL